MNGSWAVQWCPLLLDLRFLVLPWKIISLSIVNVITGWTCFNKKALNHSPEWFMFGRPPIHWAASLFPAVNPSWTPATHWPWTLAGSVPALRNTSAWFLYPLKLSCVLIQFIEQNILTSNSDRLVIWCQINWSSYLPNTTSQVSDAESNQDYN